MAKASKNNPKLLFKFINQNRKITNSVECLRDQRDERITNRREIANLLNEHFKSVFLQNVPDDYDYESDNEHINGSEFSITTEDVHKLLLGLNACKTPGRDKIHPLVIQKCADELALPISMIFQCSIDSGMLPEQWKEANVTPIHKNGSKTDPSNYRPVSVTSILCKTIERIIRKSL